MFSDLFKMFALDADYATDEFLDEHDDNKDGKINKNEWNNYATHKMKGKCRKENLNLQSEAEEFRIKLDTEYTPTSHYYSLGKLGVLKTDRLNDFDQCF